MSNVMTLDEIDDTSQRENGYFFVSEVAKGKSFISTYWKVGRDVAFRTIPIFYCVWALWARYFSLPLSAKLGDTRPSRARFRNCPTSHSWKKSVRCQKRNCSSSGGIKRVNRQILAFGRNFLFDERHKSRAMQPNGRSYVSPRQWWRRRRTEQTGRKRDRADNRRQITHSGWEAEMTEQSQFIPFWRGS